MHIANHKIGGEVFIIAEAGNNHEGNFDTARKLVDLAAEAGVHAIKFQTFKTENFINPSQKERFQQLKSYELSEAQFAELAENANKAGLIFLSTPFDLESADFLNTVVPAFKIGSGENTFYPLISKVASFAKPTIISTGYATYGELDRSVETFKNAWSGSTNPELILLHCVSNYPAENKDLNLNCIKTLGERYGLPVGFSDHSLGIEAALTACALGAVVIEKHFTHDKSRAGFRDHALSADLKDLKELVRRSRDIRIMLGNGGKVVTESEINALKVVKRTICAKKPLPSGHALQMEDLIWTRPFCGLAAGEESLILGRKILSPVEEGSPILEENLS